MSVRFFYAYGYATQERAYEAMIDCFNEGTLSYGDRPEIKSYVAKNGKIRWGIEVNG